VNVLSTERLVLRHLRADDADFILELLNEPSFIRNIGDKGIRTVDGARDYIVEGPVRSYEKFGFGLFAVELKETREPIGMCGLIKRDSLEDVDVGFAFLPKYWSKGYAYESASAVMDWGRATFGLDRIVAITDPENYGSIRVLEKLGLKFEKMITMPGDAAAIKLYGSQ
jgi:[ribosomal protein S5]-alanine N-acetyltransferase